jgi:hypothetical protein
MESDDIGTDVWAVAYIPNRRLIAELGRQARAEQERLERQLRLRNGRTPG